MELIGLKVKHAVFGVGIIIKKESNYITVEFAEKTTKFVHPDAFEKYITAEDTAVQQAIIDGINEARSKAEQKRQTEEAVRDITVGFHRDAIAVVSPRVKNTNTFDEMFAPDYHAEKLARLSIFTYKQVEDQFGIRIVGYGRGINPTDNAVVLISSIGKARGKFVYHDKWTPEGDYLYSGEGKNGDQTMTKGNLAIRDAARNGKKIHLFVKFSPQEYYYQGIFELVDYTCEDEKDENDSIHKEYKFRLKKVSEA